MSKELEDSLFKRIRSLEGRNVALEAEIALNRKESAKKSELKAVVKEFVDLMDKMEVSDNGNEFRPNFISSCRCLDGPRLEFLVRKMGELTK